MDNKVSDLRYAVKFENYVKKKNKFFIKQNICFWTNFFFCSWKSIFLWVLRFKLPQHFFAEADTKKHRYVSTKTSAFAHCGGEFRTLLPRIQKLYQITYMFCDPLSSVSIQPFDTNLLAQRGTLRLQCICRAQLIIHTTHLPCRLPCNYVTSLSAYCRG